MAVRGEARPRARRHAVGQRYPPHATAWYAGTTARAALEQAEELGRALEELGERLRE